MFLSENPVFIDWWLQIYFFVRKFALFTHKLGKFVHYNDVIMGAITSQITSPTIVFSTVYSDADQGKHQSSASLAFMREIHRGPVNSPHKWPVTRKMFPFDDVIMMTWAWLYLITNHRPYPPPYKLDSDSYVGCTSQYVIVSKVSHFLMREIAIFIVWYIRWGLCIEDAETISMT